MRRGLKGVCRSPRQSLLDEPPVGRPRDRCRPTRHARPNAKPRRPPIQRAAAGGRSPDSSTSGTDREISASFEQEKSATEVGQPTPVG